MDGKIFEPSTTFIQKPRAENDQKGFILADLCDEFWEGRICSWWGDED
jgi:hypothetical protein